MQQFFQQVANGAANGVLYASMALALVLIYKGTHVLNAAQGEMALFSAYVGWTLSNLGLPVAVTFLLVMAGAFLMGCAFRFVVAPIERSKAGPLGVLSITLGLFLTLNSAVSMIWGDIPKAFPSPFPPGRIDMAGVVIPIHQIGTMILLALVIALVTVFFSRTRLGLFVKAAAENRTSASLGGIPVARMLAIAWGLAAAIGALAGMLIAHTAFLTPPVMFGVLIYGITSAILGGFDSPGGAIVGGLVVGVTTSLIEYYVPVIGSDLKIVAAIAMIIVLLLVRPQGLFGTKQVSRL